MFHLFARLHFKFIQFFFWIIHKSSFKSLSRSSFFVNPYRFDGANGIVIKDKTFFNKGVWLYCCGINGINASLSIGKGCVFGYNNHISCVRNVTINDFVLTANNVYISDNLHEYQNINTPIIDQPILFKRVVEIGRGAWIGENVSIIGASVGRNSVIGANSVVTRDIPDYCVAIGAPAVVIKEFDIKLNKWVRKK